MPHIAISMFPGRSPEIKKALASRVRETVADELGIDKSVVSVSVEDIPKEHWQEHMEKIPAENMYTE